MGKLVLVTRYSMRTRTPVQRWFRDQALFSAERLEHRFALFELATFPSVVAQLDQDFDWVIATDVALPGPHLERLRRLARRRSRTFVVLCGPTDEVWRAHWLRERLGLFSGPLLTTVLDDDDALPRQFMSEMRQLMETHMQSGDKPALTVFGYLSATQWDLNMGDGGYPFGRFAPWHRRRRGGDAYPLNCGLSLCTPSAAYDLCILGLYHVDAKVVFDVGFSPSGIESENGANLLASVRDEASQGLTDETGVDAFVALEAHIAPPLVLNHLFNDQFERVYEPKRDPQPVMGPESFPDIGLDWEAVLAYRRAFGGAGKKKEPPLPRRLP